MVYHHGLIHIYYYLRDSRHIDPSVHTARLTDTVRSLSYSIGTRQWSKKPRLIANQWMVTHSFVLSSSITIQLGNGRQINDGILLINQENELEPFKLDTQSHDEIAISLASWMVARSPPPLPGYSAEYRDREYTRALWRDFSHVTLVDGRWLYVAMNASVSSDAATFNQRRYGNLSFINDRHRIWMMDLASPPSSPSSSSSSLASIENNWVEVPTMMASNPIGAAAEARRFRAICSSSI
jgi:hypothetical protein